MVPNSLSSDGSLASASGVEKRGIFIRRMPKMAIPRIMSRVNILSDCITGIADMLGFILGGIEICLQECSKTLEKYSLVCSKNKSLTDLFAFGCNSLQILK